MKIDKFRANLKHRIKELGYTQEEFANKIELSNSALKKYMSNGINTSLPDIEIFDRMCNVLDCDYDYLMGEIDTPHRYVYDVKQVIGLSDESISILASVFKKTNPLYWSQDFDTSNIPHDVIQMYKRIDEVNTLNYKELLSVIDFIIKNSEGNDFLSCMQMFLFSDFIIENESSSVELLDKNNGYTVHFNPNFAKESLLARITFQLQKWKEEIEKQKMMKE